MDNTWGMDVQPRVYREEHYRYDTLMLWADRGEKESGVLTDFQFTIVEPGFAAPRSASIQCESGSLQALFDDLWNIGYRPSEDRFGASKFEKATSGHIADLQKVNDKLFALVSKARK